MQPKTLFIAADGPKNNSDLVKCGQVREIFRKIDWDCKIFRNFSDVNLGCKIRVSSAIDWFFQSVDRGIIIEDDCLPNQSFFRFSEILLEKYNNDEKVMMISGNNFHQGKIYGDGSYFFSKYPHIWGWASWKRAWAKYDVNIKTFSDFKKQNTMENILKDRRSRAFWMKNFEGVYRNKIDTWDYQWTYAIFRLGGFCITPNVNLVSNIGFRSDATHTVSPNEFSDTPSPEILHIKHPTQINIDEEADIFEEQYIFKSTKAVDYSKIPIKIWRQFYRILK
jgi:hypothetical protein